jgi:ketosteroid isomerase-like protein
MSQNVDVVRRAYSILGDMPGARRGDYDEAYIDHFSEDAELVPPAIYPDVEPLYVGLEEWKGWLRQIDDVFDDWGFEVEEFIDAGERVIVLVRTSGTAKQSGAAVTIPAAHVHTVRDSRVVRLEVFLDRREAFEAAGLSERAGPGVVRPA